MEEKIPAVKIIQTLTAKLLMKAKIICGADTIPPAFLWMKTAMASATDMVLPVPLLTKTATVSVTDAALPVPLLTKTATASATDAVPVPELDAAMARDTAADNPKALTMRSPKEIDRAIELYADTIRRICMIYLKNYTDTEDIFQTVFLKYLQSTQIFENQAHEKAWFIRVSINACKDLKKSFFHSRTVSLDTLVSQPAVQNSDNREVLEAVLSLPQKYRNVIYLHYYEGYTAPQIGQLLGKKTNTIYTLLTRARLLLKEKLGGEDYE